MRPEPGSPKDWLRYARADIEHLIDLLPSGILRTPDLIAAAQLTIYATLSRYPTDEEPVSESEYQEALQIAESTLAWAELQVNS